MASPPAAPALPRAPTAIRGDELPARAAAAGPRAAPPRFPSLTDVGLAPGGAALWEDELPGEKLAGEAPFEKPRRVVQQPPPDAAPGVVQRLRALVSPPKAAAAAELDARERAARRPLAVRAKLAVCALPDPTLLFMAVVAAVVAVRGARPDALRAWPARVAVPLLLAQAIAASALWRRTRVRPVRPGASARTMAAPFPDAGVLVGKGERLREREARLVKAETELRAGQMKLEVQRKEIESRLPPHIDVAVDCDTGAVHRTTSAHSRTSRVSDK